MQNTVGKKLAVTLLVLAIAFLGISQYAHAQRRVVVTETKVVRGPIVRTLPKNHVVITHRNVRYRYVNGVYYRPKGNGFVVVSAPMGIRVTSLPRTATVVRVRGKRYYRYEGIYYRKSGRTYEVVRVA
ncbi:MAG: DUF6515 family protein [Bacteroidota bacterium]